MNDVGFWAYIISHMVIIWIALAIIFAVIEGFTLGFVTIWFTIGAIVSAIVSLLGVNLLVQIVIFFAVSIILLIFTRPILVKHLKVGREKNIIENIEGKIGLVTEPIEPFKSGLVKVNGIIWTAIGDSNDMLIETGQEVEVKRVEGVKLIVVPAHGN
jgi:membrane protein implicated in regulation of membrane protease activity